MKEFVMKYKVVISIAVLLILFVLLSFLVDDGILASSRQMKESISEWATETKEDKYVVTVIGQTTCGHCIAYKPVLQKVYNENENMVVYWFDVNTGFSEEDYSTLTTTYELPGYEGTPYTFVTKNGQIVASYERGAMERDTLISFLKDNKVI